MCVTAAASQTFKGYARLVAKQHRMHSMPASQLEHGQRAGSLWIGNDGAIILCRILVLELGIPRDAAIWQTSLQTSTVYYAPDTFCLQAVRIMKYVAGPTVPATNCNIMPHAGKHSMVSRACTAQRIMSPGRVKPGGTSAESLLVVPENGTCGLCVDC
jgi:hypothetical protein